MAEHKHAAVLRAIADKGLGAAQWQDNKGGLMAPWHDCDGFITPITHSFLAWRIKPERKPDVVRYVNVYGVSGVGELCKSDIEASANRSYAYGMASGMLRLTLSDNEGSYTLKSAEVLP